MLINKYSTTAIIEDGENHQTYFAKHQLNSSRYILKVVKVNPQSRMLLKYLENEHHYLSKLQTAGIVELVEYIQQANSHLLVTKIFATSITLKQFLAEYGKPNIAKYSQI